MLTIKRLQLSLIKNSCFTNYIKRFAASHATDPKSIALYEPIFEEISPEIPLYGPINLRFRGYDFVLLERYQKYVHDLTKLLGIQISDTWATPCCYTKVSLYKHKTTTTYESFKLAYYERNVQIDNAPSHLTSLLIEILKTNLPRCVEFRAKLHEPDDTEVRLVPEYEVMELEKRIAEVEVAKKKLQIGPI